MFDYHLEIPSHEAPQVALRLAEAMIPFSYEPLDDQLVEIGVDDKDAANLDNLAKLDWPMSIEQKGTVFYRTDKHGRDRQTRMPSVEYRAALEDDRVWYCASGTISR